MATNDERRSWVSNVEANRPSLAELDERQQGSLDELVDGFVDRVEVIRWLRRLGLVTLGGLPDRFVRDVPLSRSVLSHLIVSSERERFALDEPPERETARKFRERFAARILPHHRDAVREFRSSAVEYLDESNRPEPGRAESVAHRPSLSVLDARQVEALDALLGGELESERDVIGWARSLNLATEGEIGNDDASRDIVERLSEEGASKEVLIARDGEPESHQEARVRFSAYHLLPAFNAGVRKLWNRVGEDTSTESEGLSSKSL